MKYYTKIATHESLDEVLHRDRYFTDPITGKIFKAQLELIDGQLVYLTPLFVRSEPEQWIPNTYVQKESVD